MRRFASWSAATAALAVVAAAAAPADSHALPRTCPPLGVALSGALFREVAVPAPVERGSATAVGAAVGRPYCEDTWPPPPGAVPDAPRVPLVAIRGVRMKVALRHRSRPRIVYVRLGVCDGVRPARLVSCLRRAR